MLLTVIAIITVVAIIVAISIFRKCGIPDHQSSVFKRRSQGRDSKSHQCLTLHII